jgi:hypothetical protein
LETGLKIDNMVMVLNFGQMLPSSKDSTNSVRSMESATLDGMILHVTSENFTITLFMGKVFIRGAMAEYMKEPGSSIRCTGTDPLPGLTAVST